jgi:hypothetical protein
MIEIKYTGDALWERIERAVDIILNEPDLDRAIAALSAEGFIYRRSAGVTMFLDGPNAKTRDADSLKMHARFPLIA